jgi:hypothetical protein
MEFANDGPVAERIAGVEAYRRARQIERLVLIGGKTPVLVVHVRRRRRTEAVETVHVEAWCALVVGETRKSGRYRFECGPGVEGEVMVDELTEVGIGGRDIGIFLIVRGIGGIIDPLVDRGGNNADRRIRVG